MDTTTKTARRTVTKYDVQFYTDVYSWNTGMPTPPTSTANDECTSANKKRRLSPPDPGLTLTISGNAPDKVVTPAPSPPPETMSLRLIIPHPVLTKEDHRTLAIRRAAAERWKPKLQKPFPKHKEVSEAYNLKLMRHYASPTASPESNFVRPHIEVSPRVVRLRAQFPRSCTSNQDLQVPATRFTPTAPPMTVRDVRTMDDHMRLRVNKDITRSEQAQRLAWESFSATERDRIDRDREAMMESGLVMEDLIKEARGVKNGLPEWKKCKTGRFAKENRNIPK
jgi:hypothetical protein